MRELSVFFDESGDIGTGSEYYLLTLVFHNQSDDIDSWLSSYEQACTASNLPKDTFHFTPVLRGHAPFDSMGYSTRKRLLSRFRYFVERLPFKYVCLSYEKRRFSNTADLQAKMQRDIERLIRDNLVFFQEFDVVKVYYDNGQSIVSTSVHGAISAALFEDAVVYRNIKPNRYRLFQVADYICGIELAAIRYERNQAGSTEERFLGSWKDFRQNYLKKLRRHRLG